MKRCSPGRNERGADPAGYRRRIHVHTVLVTLRRSADRERCAAEMRRLDGRIDGMVGFDLRFDELGGPFAADLELTTRWVDLHAYRAYEQHPLHLEVRAVVIDLMESASTVDYTERSR